MAGMTTRKSPVGVIVIALASVFAVGCTAGTTAVFQTLLDPAAAPVSPSGSETEADAVPDSTAGGWYPHPDGYAMALPVGWSGLSVSPAQTDQLIDALAGSHPDLAGQIDGVLQETRSRVSMVAVDLTTQEEVPAVVLVVSQPTDGRRARFVKMRTDDQISSLPGLRGPVFRRDERLPNAVGVRFDYVLDHADVGALRVRTYLFRFGGQAYLVSFVAAESGFDEAEAAFDAIAASLRFGV